MITAGNWEVIQGDEGCKDGHYRDKQDLRRDKVAAWAQIPRWNWIRTTPLLCKRKTRPPVFLPSGMPLSRGSACSEPGSRCAACSVT